MHDFWQLRQTKTLHEGPQNDSATCSAFALVDSTVSVPIHFFAMAKPMWEALFKCASSLFLGALTCSWKHCRLTFSQIQLCLQLSCCFLRPTLSWNNNNCFPSHADPFCTALKATGLLSCLQNENCKLWNKAKMNVTFERGSARDPSAQSSLC